MSGKYMYTNIFLKYFLKIQNILFHVEKNVHLRRLLIFKHSIAI